MKANLRQDEAVGEQRGCVTSNCRLRRAIHAPLPGGCMGRGVSICDGPWCSDAAVCFCVLTAVVVAAFGSAVRCSGFWA